MRAVFFEDFTALIALAFAVLGMVLHQLTGKVVYDAAGSILIGVLMGMIALLQINLNRKYLEGKPLAPKMRAEAIWQLKSFPEVERVTFLYGEVIGPDRIALFAGVTIAGEHTQTELAYILRDLEHRMVKNTYVGIAILSLATPDEEDARP
jgi:divalent metal cation (Fe/Co/Zn/Cd) transporter